MAAKGIELPTNAIVFLVLGIVALLAMVGFLLQSTGPFGANTGSQTEFLTECAAYVSAGGCGEGFDYANYERKEQLEKASRASGVAANPDSIKNACCNR